MNITTSRIVGGVLFLLLPALCWITGPLGFVAWIILMGLALEILHAMRLLPPKG